MAEIIITNSGGREMFVSDIILPAKVNLNGLPDGFYFVKIKTDNKTVIKKLVIN